MIIMVKKKSGRKHTIKIDADLDWIVPYIKLSGKLGIPLETLEEIRGYRVPLNKKEQQFASVSDRGSNKHCINILKELQNANRDRLENLDYYHHRHKHFFEHTLDVLAHELSHLAVWEHTSDRYILEKKLQLRFSRLAKKLGYKGYTD